MSVDPSTQEKKDREEIRKLLQMTDCRSSKDTSAEAVKVRDALCEKLRVEKETGKVWTCVKQGTQSDYFMATLINCRYRFFMLKKQIEGIVFFFFRKKVTMLAKDSQLKWSKYKISMKVVYCLLCCQFARTCKFTNWVYLVLSQTGKALVSSSLCKMAPHHTQKTKGCKEAIRAL